VDKSVAGIVDSANFASIVREQNAYGVVHSSDIAMREMASWSNRAGSNNGCPPAREVHPWLFCRWWMSAEYGGRKVKS
jgi:hypothetical protein